MGISRMVISRENTCIWHLYGFRARFSKGFVILNYWNVWKNDIVEDMDFWSTCDCFKTSYQWWTLIIFFLVDRREGVNENSLAKMVNLALLFLEHLVTSNKLAQFYGMLQIPPWMLKLLLLFQEQLQALESDLKQRDQDMVQLYEEKSRLETQYLLLDKVLFDISLPHHCHICAITQLWWWCAPCFLCCQYVSALRLAVLFVHRSCIILVNLNQSVFSSPASSRCVQ